MKSEVLLQNSGKLFSQRASLLTLWQSIAENHYPERADFTVQRSLGTELAEGLATGVPIIVRRDLGNAIGGILRPTNKEWAHTRVDKWDEIGTEARAWLEMADDRQRRAMYHRPANFVRATKEADHDFVTFGQAVLQVSVNSKANDLLYRTWHLRDCAWDENADGKIDTVYRKWSVPARRLEQMFPKTVHQNVRKLSQDDPMRLVNVLHCFVPNDEPDSRQPYKSVHLDCDNEHIMEEVAMNIFEYVIPRWQTVSGSQYAYSPAVVVGLPDARTLQEMTITLLEAGEKAVSPPLLGVQGALRSDVNVMAGGLTWVDREYDERLGEVLRPLTVDKNGIPLGLDMAQQIEMRLKDAFYINQLTLPPAGGPDMTAYEVGQRVQEHIRQVMPLFEPIETEYNAPLCETTFEILMRFGVFGSPDLIPEELQGKDITFSFESPLHDAAERAKAQRYLEATSLVANAIAADPSTAYLIDHKRAAREALQVSGVPNAWLRSEAEVDILAQQQAEQEQQAALLQQMQAGADIANKIGMTPAPSGTGGTGERPL